MNYSRLLFLISAVTLLSSCSYYKITTVPVDKNLEKVLLDPDKYIVVHHKDSANRLKEINVSVQDGNLVSKAEKIPKNHMFYKTDFPNKSFKYDYTGDKMESPFKDVHLYVDSIHRFKIDGVDHCSIQQKDISDVEVYKFQFFKTLWWALLLAASIIGVMAFLFIKFIVIQDWG